MPIRRITCRMLRKRAETLFRAFVLYLRPLNPAVPGSCVKSLEVLEKEVQPPPFHLLSCRTTWAYPPEFSDGRWSYLGRTFFRSRRSRGIRWSRRSCLRTLEPTEPESPPFNEYSDLLPGSGTAPVSNPPSKFSSICLMEVTLILSSQPGHVHL